MTDRILAETFSTLEAGLQPYHCEPAGTYVCELVAEPRLEPSLGHPPFLPDRFQAGCLTFSTLYFELPRLAYSAFRSFKQNNNLAVYRKQKEWLGRVARESGDSLLLQAGLFPEAILTTRPRKGLWAVNYDDALARGPVFYDFAMRLNGLEEGVGRDLYHHFGEWVIRLHELKRAFHLWARDLTLNLRLEEIGMRRFKNVTLFRR